MSSPSFRGGSTQQGITLDAYHQILDSSFTYTCMPWTGPDTSGQHVCPGFQQTKEWGLVCYVVPLLAVQGGIDGVQLSPSRGVVLPEKRYDYDEDAYRIHSLYRDVLEASLRRVKIIGYPELEIAVTPKNDDYQVWVVGHWNEALYGFLVPFVDHSGAKFTKPIGKPVDEMEAQKAKIPTKLTPEPAVDLDAVATKPVPSGVGIARVEQAQAQYDAQAGLPSSGAPQPGKLVLKECLSGT